MTQHAESSDKEPEPPKTERARRREERAAQKRLDHAFRAFRTKERNPSDRD